MNIIFKPHLHKFMLVLFDDILVYNNSLVEHQAHLRMLLQILRDNKFVAKKTKCSLRYLGHLVTSAGIQVDPSKIEVVQSWPVPHNIKGLRGFLGLVGHYKRFIKNFAQVAAPLTNLLKKRAFQSTHEAQIAFENLKIVLTKTPLLTLPDFSKEFVVETDASRVGIRAVLSQGRRIIAFFSQKLSSRLQATST